MSEPFLAEIKIITFDYAPKGWAFCNGQLLALAQNTALFSLLGTTYGGNGTSNFKLPDLRGRTPVHMGEGIALGESAGEETHTLIITEIPAHTHLVSADTAAGTDSAPTSNVYAQATTGLGSVYGVATNLTAANSQMIGFTGSSQPHSNMQPYLTLNFVIALQGIFPSVN